MLMFVRVDCDRKRVGERILIRSMPEKSARLLPAVQVQPQKNSSGALLAALANNKPAPEEEFSASSSRVGMP